MNQYPLPIMKPIEFNNTFESSVKPDTQQIDLRPTPARTVTLATTAPFSPLPAEVRRSIYIFLFDTATLIYDPICPDILLNAHRPILSTCHTIRQEATHVLYKAILSNLFQSTSFTVHIDKTILTPDRLVTFHKFAQLTVKPSCLLSPPEWINNLRSIRVLMDMSLTNKNAAALAEADRPKELIWLTVEKKIKLRLTGRRQPRWIGPMLEKSTRPLSTLLIVCHLEIGAGRGKPATSLVGHKAKLVLPLK